MSKNLVLPNEKANVLLYLLSLTALLCRVGLVAGRFSRIRTTVYSALRLWIGVGLTVHFVLSIFVQQEVLLWIIVAVAATGMPLYGIVDRSGRFLCL